ncbi:MAG: hypothetical protein WAqPseu_35220 [Shewanella algae]
MNIRRLIKIVSKDFPELTCFGNYLVFKRFEFVLSGIAIEKTGSGIYFYKFMYPTFDIQQEVNLLYSERLGAEKYYLDITNLTAGIIEFELRRRIRMALNQIEKVVSLEDFIDVLNSREGLREHSHARMVCGLSLLLLNREDESELVFEEVKGTFHPSIAKDCLDFIDIAKRSPDEARKVLFTKDTAFKIKYKLTIEKVDTQP